MKRKKFFCVDAHTCGNPVRLVAGGGPLLLGDSMFERRLHFLKDYDWIRKGLMFEPKGHDLMSGSILYPPTDPANDIGILFIETSGCLPMCGHGTIGTITVGIEEGLIDPKQPGQVRIETPAGLVVAKYIEEEKRVKSVTITNVPSFLHSQKLSICLPELGFISFDVAYGGNFYAIIDPQENYDGLEKMKATDLISLSPKLRNLINKHYKFEHPENPLIQGVSHIMWTGKPKLHDSDGRNAVFYGDKAIDRSPCGTGTSARMAQLTAQGKLGIGDRFVHESIIGSQFIGKVESLTSVGSYQGIIPSIEGWARITGYNTLIIDEEDPYAYGFQVI
jgi:4-hydroxyproline epimerase